MANETIENSGTALKADSVNKFDVIVIGISAAAPVMCLAASLGDIMSGSGTAASLAFILATIVLIMVGNSFGQLSARYNSAGGAYAYVRSAIGPKVGFVTAWTNGVTNLCTGVIGAVFCTYLHALVPSVPLWAGVLILFIPVFLIGWRGVELSTKVLIIVWVAQMALILIPAIRVWTLNAGQIESVLSNSAQAFVPSFGLSGLMLAVLVCVWCYVGFECPAYMGEEIKGGNKSVKFAITVSALGIGVIYAVTCWIWTAAMPKEMLDEILSSGTLLVDYCKIVGYGAGGTLVSLAALVSCVGCFISFATAAPRCFYDMGLNKYLPANMGKVNKYQTPHVALIFYSILWLAAALYGAYGNMSHLFTFMALAATTTYILVCVAHIKDYWKAGGAKQFIVNKLIPLIAIAIMAWMILSSDKLYLGIFGLILLVIIIASFVWEKKK